MPRPISGNALTATERTRRRRERLAQEEAERKAEARRQAQAEREAHEKMIRRIKGRARTMCLGWTLPPIADDAENIEAWKRLIAYIERWNGR